MPHLIEDHSKNIVYAGLSWVVLWLVGWKMHTDALLSFRIIVLKIASSHFLLRTASCVYQTLSESRSYGHHADVDNCTYCTNVHKLYFFFFFFKVAITRAYVLCLFVAARNWTCSLRSLPITCLILIDSKHVLLP